MEKILYKQNLNKNANCNIWCAYPACYSFAMSSLGYLWIFKSIDEDENIIVERVYTDSKSTKLQINEIDAICFSFSFDMDDYPDKYFMPIVDNYFLINSQIIENSTLLNIAEIEIKGKEKLIKSLEEDRKNLDDIGVLKDIKLK